MEVPSSSLALSAWSRIKTAHRPATRSAHMTHLRTLGVVRRGVAQWFSPDGGRYSYGGF